MESIQNIWQTPKISHIQKCSVRLYSSEGKFPADLPLSSFGGWSIVDLEQNETTGESIVGKLPFGNAAVATLLDISQMHGDLSFFLQICNQEETKTEEFCARGGALVSSSQNQIPKRRKRGKKLTKFS